MAGPPASPRLGLPLGCRHLPGQGGRIPGQTVGQFQQFGVALDNAQGALQKATAGFAGKELGQVGQFLGQEHTLGKAEGVDGLPLQCRVLGQSCGQAAAGQNHPAAPPLGQECGQGIAPQGVPPAVAGREQILQIVQHQQQRVLFQHSPQPGQCALAEGGRVVQIGGQGQAGHVQLALHLKEKVVERPAHIHAHLRPFEPDIAHKAPLPVAVGQLQSTGRLARAGHAIEEDAPLGVGRGQGLAGPAHGSQTAHKALRLRGEGDAQTGAGQFAQTEGAGGQGELQLLGGPAQQNRRGRGKGGIGAGLRGQDFVQGQMERAGQGAAFVQQFVAEAVHQVRGKGVAHGVAHGQGRTAQALGQLLAQAGQHSDPHLLALRGAGRGGP